MKFLLYTTLLACLISQLGCQRKNETSNLPVKRYELHGRVVRLDPQTHGAVINGQKIEGWMEAMTMTYPVKSESDYQALRPGEHIQATVLVQGMNFWIADVRPEPSKNQ